MKLGWVDESNIRTIGYGQQETLTIDPLGLKSSKISLVKVPITTDRYYLIETRVKVGGDAGLPLDVRPGVIITEVDEGSDPAKVTWISNPTPRTSVPSTQIQDLAFSEGDKLSTNLVGSINILSKSQNSYLVEVDRTAVYPRIIDGRYDYDGIKFTIPSGWRTVTAGWDTYAAKDNPLLSLAKQSGMTMTVRFLDPEIELEGYSSNPFFQNVECRSTYQGYVKINGLVAKETALRCSSTLESGESKAPVASTYQFGFSRTPAGSATIDNRLLSLTLVADSPGVFDTYLADFETTINTIQIRNATDVRQIESESIGLREYILQVSIANSTMDIPLYTNTAYSNFKFDPDKGTLSFKANAKDSNGKTRIPYDTFLKGPYVLSVGGKTSKSFLILEDEVSGERFMQINHQAGISDILITGMSSLVPTLPPLVVDDIELEESELPVEIVFRQPQPKHSNPHPSVLSKWVQLTALLT